MPGPHQRPAAHQPADLSRENEYGIKLVSLDEAFREKREPGAAPLKERLAALRALHDAGCKTWVSIEPFPTPNMIQQDLGQILDAVRFVDRIIFGRLHYSKTASAYPGHNAFYNACTEEVLRFCSEQGIGCHIKHKTQTGE